MTEFVLSGLHEKENKTTDVVEYLVWRMVNQDGFTRGVTITDIANQCVFTSAAQVNNATNSLVRTGRISPQQGPNFRSMGRRTVTRYFPVKHNKPFLLR